MEQNYNILFVHQGDGRCLMQNQAVRKWAFANNEESMSVLGPHDVLLGLLDKAYQAKVVIRGTELSFIGDEEEVEQMYALVQVIVKLTKMGVRLSENDYRYAIDLAKNHQIEELPAVYSAEIATTFKGKVIRAKTLGQRRYIEAINKHDVVFGIGPAGTGKTYLAVAMAVMALKRGDVKRIILTRPAVEAGENLGFLPGDLQEKVDPYLRPLYDGLYDVYGPEQVLRAMERNNIEIAPLAYMRGRTLESSFVILDEAQNTTPEQMKMFLTRLGFDSKMVVTGDVTQVDLPRGRLSGLIDAAQVLTGVSGVGFHYFTGHDVVRHHLVQRIIDAYEGKPANGPENA